MTKCFEQQARRPSSAGDRRQDGYRMSNAPSIPAKGALIPHSQLVNPRGMTHDSLPRPQHIRSNDRTPPPMGNRGIGAGIYCFINLKFIFKKIIFMTYINDYFIFFVNFSFLRDFH